MRSVNKVINFALAKKDCVRPVFKQEKEADIITVSIHCFVYNHQKYLSRCLDSFLNQLVDFNVEIIIHDDFSDDGSKAIIDSYFKRYPNIVKPIYESQNVYSMTGSFVDMAVATNAKSSGKYIALCEGDDFWIDPLKLYLQVSVLDYFGDCGFCVHRVKAQSVDTNYSTDDKTIPLFKMNSKMLTDKHFISLVYDRYNFQTSSYFFRAADYSSLLKLQPEFLKVMPNLDESLLRYFGSLGKTCFIDRVMSVYQQFAQGSWSINHKENKGDKKREEFFKALEEFDLFTNFKYKKSSKKLVNKTRLFDYMEVKDYKTIFKNRDLRKTLRRLDFRTYISLGFKIITRKIK
ncbi:MAG: glycosyltransferase family 2 protein [Clostridia bacterium]|nr:glycosyltransferase family 2 protein [Clostridia bacterium]